MTLLLSALYLAHLYTWRDEIRAELDRKAPR